MSGIFSHCTTKSSLQEYRKFTENLSSNICVILDFLNSRYVWQSILLFSLKKMLHKNYLVKHFFKRTEYNLIDANICPHIN